VDPDPDWPEIGPLPLYHCQLNVVVPPVTVADSVTVCPLSIVTEDGETRIEGAEFTVTWSTDEDALVGVGVVLSVTT